MGFQRIMLQLQRRTRSKMMIQRYSPAAILAGRGCLCALLLLTAACAERQSDEANRDTTFVGPTARTDTAGISRQGTSRNQTDADGEDEAATGLLPIYSVLVDEDRFSILVDAAETAGLDETLLSGGPYTVFVPTNDAFDRMDMNVQELLRGANVDRLRDILLYHVSNGTTPASDLPREPLRSLAGYDIRIDDSDGLLRANGAPIIDPDLSASNGVVHVIDAVLLPDTDEDDQ